MTAVIIVDGKMTDCDKCRGPVTIQAPQPCTIGFSAEGGYDYVNMVVYVVNKKDFGQKMTIGRLMFPLRLPMRNCFL